MTEILAPYSHQHFHSLPTVRDAHDAFQRLDGDRHVEGWLKDLFVQHGMERRFGLAMIHRHFDLQPGERLVEYVGTSTPWDIGGDEENDDDDDDDDEKSPSSTQTAAAAAAEKTTAKSTAAGLARAPQPSMWAFDKQGRLRPTEYRYSGTDDDKSSSSSSSNSSSNDKKNTNSTTSSLADDSRVLAFVAALGAALDAHGLAHLFGLARYPGDDFRGSCEITQGRSNINLLPKDYPTDLRAFSTIWYFSPPLWELRCNCKCNEITEIHTHSHRWVL